MRRKTVRGGEGIGELDLFPSEVAPVEVDHSKDVRSFLAGLSARPGILIEGRMVGGMALSVYEGEFWTAKQRAGHGLHEVSYRACFKPQLPAFFIERLCPEGGTVYDPFMGRGTTLLEAQLLGRRALGNDANPLSRVLTAPRLRVPTLEQIRRRLDEVKLPVAEEIEEDLLVFFAAETLREIYGWRAYFRQRREKGTFDEVDAWLQMVACNRLTGHSNGFFSVYTLPPNQATSVVAQRRINAKRNQVPEPRDTRALIWKKSRQLLKDALPPQFFREDAEIFSGSADATPGIPSGSVDLVVTSPPFLNVVDYVGDNWLRLWFCQIELEKAAIWQVGSVEEWVGKMARVFVELKRVVRRGGVIAFEVGEVRKQTVLLENEVVRAAMGAGLRARGVLVNRQNFTKTANCWGVSNNTGGTNSNRVVILEAI